MVREKRPSKISKTKKISPLDHHLPLTDECLHFNDISEVPHDLKRYFHQRHSLFLHYAYDIRLTPSAWFGVTPEPIARRIAADIPSHLGSTPSKDTIVDLFAGAGGNTIAFALAEKWARIIAIEKDPATLACAQHNAAVYGVSECITWVLGDSMEYLSRLRRARLEGKPPEEVGVDDRLWLDPARTVLFASPPWGGVGYREQEVFDLEGMQPYGLRMLHGMCWEMEHVLYLPRTSDLRQIAALVGDGEDRKIECVQYCMDGASKALVAYIPAERGDQDQDGGGGRSDE